MNVSELVLEERYATVRDTIFHLLNQSSDYLAEVANMFIDVFSPVEDHEHGPILWSIMTKSTGIKTGVLGLHFKAYIQYYYLYRVSASQREAPNRHLDVTAQAYLVCCAAFGHTRGATEFDKAFFAQDSAVIDNTIIDKASFTNFFESSDDQFSFMHMWRIIDRLWEAWDCTSPILVHGFVTTLVSEKMLLLRLKQPGSFLMRWSSKGGLAVDFIRDGRLEKAHWKFASLTDINSLRALLWDPVQWGPALQYLVDTTNDAGFNTSVVPKEVCFPNVQSYEDDSHMDSDVPVRGAYSFGR